ncbi:hypothetical protein IVB02_22180 [Bradyrhizobium sp. 166]|uniref:hypothetical protein n=1 Tax=Bradyrhizobium sp. 166 TaxID=2782638 RepID=UPI001FF8A5A7|nr:hypothetical protein [Bradyrhizobium sp. 166]MCK1604063.1 hypothetical protein [Bradyrhizobium sp. 166]
MWSATDEFLRKDSQRVVPLNEIFDFWRDRPFRIKDGIHAVLGLAYALSRRDHLATYRQEVFRPQWADYNADVPINDPGDIQVRRLEISASGRKLLEGVRDVLAEFDEAETTTSHSPFDVARALVATSRPWSRGGTVRCGSTPKCYLPVTSSVTLRIRTRFCLMTFRSCSWEMRVLPTARYRIVKLTPAHRQSLFLLRDHGRSRSCTVKLRVHVGVDS